ncbi:hypothetical protein OHU34_02990 [Streptomyces sp. NBC_00080]|uniref:hypothetical protein n=1 Tax=Streptomyces TaxID=1883 RepID=UPI001168CFFB|nr:MULTISPECIES: hypothetical protein [Streptomyces]TQJ37373.1 hypothetical protein FBY34_8198 [Streptomyces sp. SLBN-115]
MSETDPLQRPAQKITDGLLGDGGAPGVLVGDIGTAALEQLVPLTGGHRARDRRTAA